MNQYGGELFQKALRIAVAKSGKQAKEIAEEIGIRKESLSRLMTGSNGPSQDTMRNILEYFGYDLVEFLSLGQDDDVDQSESAQNEGLPQLTDDDLAPEHAKLLAEARMVLTCGNNMAVEALKHNIRYFAQAVTLERRLAEVEQKLSVISMRKSDNVGSIDGDKP